MTRQLLARSALSAALSLSACAPSAREPALATATRFVATPSRIAALSQDNAEPGLPAQISFDGARGRSALYLKFTADFRVHGAPLQAFIALSPLDDAPLDGAPVEIEAWRISSAWQPEQLVTWSDKPPLAPPYARAELSSASRGAQRIDVTELVRFAARNPGLDFGIALLGRGGSGHGATFATGSHGGVAPRLEVYER